MLGSATGQASPSATAVARAAAPRRAGRLARMARALGLKGVIGTSVLVVVIASAVLAEWISPADPALQQLGFRLRPPLSVGPDGVMHPFGTDHLGRDLLARSLAGARVSLVVALIGVAAAGTLGVTVGLLAGYFGGRVDTVLMTLVDTQLALPFTLVAITIGAITGQSLFNVLVVLAVTGWVLYARVVRAQALSLREREMILAARSVGCGAGRIVVRYLLPNCASAIIIISSFATASMIVAEATISFLGVGVPSWVPSWGTMISEGRNYLPVAWWVVMVPGLVITVTVIAINLVGDVLRDHLDPRLRSG